MTDDAELLRRYADEGSEEAFAELVRRHLDVVYAAAVRQMHDAHRAQDVVQIVFASLARQASGLRNRTVLLSWLYTAVHYTAAKAKRADGRRLVREHEAMTMHEISVSPGRDPEWKRLHPVLDDAMHDLAEGDRKAVLLRFFQGLTFAEIADPLGVSEDGARKRVDRALEKLRTALVRRGITSTPVALAAALSAQPSFAAPPGFAVTVARGALTGAKVAAAIAQTLVMTTLQKTILLTAFAVAVGAGLYEFRVIQSQKNSIAALQADTTKAQAGERQARREKDAALQQLNAAPPAVAGSANNPAGAASPQFDSTLRSWMTNVTLLKQQLAQMPDRGIPEFSLLSDMDWLLAIKDTPLDTETEVRVALNNLRNTAKLKFEGIVMPAINHYAEGNGGMLPPDLNALVPFFSSPVDPAILQRYSMLGTGPLAESKTLFGERPEAAVDDEYDSSFQFRRNGFSSSMVSRTKDLYEEAVQKYSAANGGQNPSGPDQLMPFLNAPVDPVRLRQIFAMMQAPPTTTVTGPRPAQR